MRAHHQKGFTLVEILLVMVIIASLIVAGTTYVTQKAESLRVDRTALQMQYILNAGLAYYVANGTWPGTNTIFYNTSTTSSSPLQPNYLPATPIPNPWGLDPSGYWHSYNSGFPATTPPNVFQVIVYVGTTAREQARGNIIAGKLPMGYYDTSGYVVSYVNIPGQDLNNATAINFAGLYHHGACVPVPTCPNTTAGGATTTSPQIFVMPVSVSGVNDQASNNVYPLSSFTAYSTAPAVAPVACTGGTAVACTPINGNAPQSGMYWRVCMQVITEKGDVQATRTDMWGQNVTMAAFTRCSISNEPAGSTFSVYSH